MVEMKLDGYRILARVEDGVARLLTRRGHDWTDKMKSLAVAIQSLGIRNGWFDGEIVVMNSRGLPDFNALQNAIGNRKNESIVYFMFDAPFYGGLDLRKVPLWSRRAVLKEMLLGAIAESIPLLLLRGSNAALFTYSPQRQARNCVTAPAAHDAFRR